MVRHNCIRDKSQTQPAVCSRDTHTHTHTPGKERGAQSQSTRSQRGRPPLSECRRRRRRPGRRAPASYSSRDGFTPGDGEGGFGLTLILLTLLAPEEKKTDHDRALHERKEAREEMPSPPRLPFPPSGSSSTSNLSRRSFSSTLLRTIGSFPRIEAALNGLADRGEN